MNVDQETLKGCMRNDPASQYRLYKMCYSFMMAICMRYAPDKDSAAAVMNEGFLKILTNLKKHKQEIPFELWMRRIIINTIIDDYRKNKKMKESIKFGNVEEDSDESDSVMNLAIRKMNLEQISVFISKLPDMSKKVFNLFIIDGYTHAEISVLLGISEGTSKWHVNAARQKLQEMILKFNEKHHRKIA